MRRLVVGGAFALAAAGAGLAGGAPINGSDTLFNVTNDVITSCGTKFNGDNIEEPGSADFRSFAIRYAGGGSAVGADQMDENVQHVAPMARTFKPEEMCSTSAQGTAVQATSEALEIGLDAIVIATNATSTCANTGALAGSANGLAVHGQTFTVNPGGTTYTIADSLDVLRLIYFGIDHNSVADCNSAVRRSLVASWGNLFSTSCSTGNTTCSGGLRHAFRMSDLSGTADAFVSLVGVGSTGRGIGNDPFASGMAVLKRTNPFCNSYDANTSTPGGPAYPVCNATTFCPQNFACAPNHTCSYTNNARTPGPCADFVACPAGFDCDTATGLCSLSDGGTADFSDWDPIRTLCGVPVPGAQQGTSGLPVAHDEVCGVDRTLGLVLPIYLPERFVGLGQTTLVSTTDLYPIVDCDPGACDLVSPARVAQVPVGYLCPDGQPLTLNKCWAPYHADVNFPLGENFNCRADRRLNHCFGLPGTAVTAEGRVYNRPIYKPDVTHNLPGANVLDLNSRLMSASFFRIRGGLNANVVGGDPSPCNQAGDATTQIGCLTSIDPCNIGFAGREATPAGSYTALSLDGSGSGAGIFPTDGNILNLLNGPPSTVYPLARRLFFASIYGLGSSQGLTVGEAELANCFGDNFITKAAVTNHNFVALPGGIRCLDYDESNVTTVISEAAGKIPGNCRAVGNPPTDLNPFNTDHNACTDSATAPVIGPTATEVYNIISHNPVPCTNCHSGSAPAGGLDLSALAFEVNTINVPSSECGGKKLINPGSSASSYLIDKLLGHAQDGGCFSGGQMPVGGFLTPFQISEIAQWIDDGAPH